MRRSFRAVALDTPKSDFVDSYNLPLTSKELALGRMLPGRNVVILQITDHLAQAWASSHLTSFV